MTLRDYIGIARRWWWVVALACVCGGGLAYLLTDQMTPVYRARAVLLVNVNQGQTPGGQSYQDILSSQQLTKTYAELVTSNINLERAAGRLNAPAVALSSLEAKVTAAAIRDTQLINVFAEDESPKRAAQIANMVAETFPKYIEEAQLAGSTAAANKGLNTVFVAESAQPPLAPVRPSKPVNVALAVMLALVLAVAAISVVEYLDDGVGSREDIQGMDVPFLGTIFEAQRPRGTSKTSWVPSILDGERDEALVESYRQVQASLAFALGATEAKILLVTSANSGEGKSTTSANLAEVLAESSKKVLLIDGDLRKPDVHRYFGLPNSSGLSTAFLAELDAVPTFLKQISESFLVLTGGPIAPNPAELLSSRRMQSMIKMLSRPFDIVIIDSPPILGLADAALWTSFADGVVLVARKGKTRRNQLEESIVAVRASHKPLIGVILNGADRKKAGGYYYRYRYGESRREGA